MAVQGFYSDLLYQPWFCATTDLQDEWLERDTIPRRPAAGLTLAQFRSEYEVPNRPVIITGLVRTRNSLPLLIQMQVMSVNILQIQNAVMCLSAPPLMHG